MSRHLFGGVADYVITVGTANAATLQPGATVTCWNAAVGGVQYTDLTATDGTTPIAGGNLTADSAGAVPEFMGPDGVRSIYLDANGGSGPRRRTIATDTGEGLTTVESDLAAHEAAANPHGTTATDVGAVPTTGGSITGTLDIAGRLQYAGFRLPSMYNTARPPRYEPATTAYLMQAGHGWTAGGGGLATSNLNDTTNFIKGSQSARVTTNGTGVQTQFRKTGLSLNLTGKAIRLIFKVDDVTHLDHLNFYVASPGFTDYYTWNFHTHNGAPGATNFVQSGEWVTVTLSWADVSTGTGAYTINANGTPSTKTGFDSLQFAVYDNAGGPVVCWLQAVEIIPDTTSTFPNGVISVTFDDSWKSQYSLARPKMDALGYRGTLYTIAEYIDSGVDRMAMGDLRTVQDFSGWEIAGHAYSTSAHGMTNGFSDLTADDVETEFTKLKLWLTGNGFTGENFAYPKGHFDVTTDGVPVDEIAAKYWATSRTIISETKEIFPVAMRQRVRAVTGINDGSGLGGTAVTSLTAAGGPLDRCKNSGDWLILCFHEIAAGTPTDATQCSQAGFNTVMDAISSRGIPVMPIREVISYYT